MIPRNDLAATIESKLAKDKIFAEIVHNGNVIGFMEVPCAKYQDNLSNDFGYRKHFVWVMNKWVMEKMITF